MARKAVVDKDIVLKMLREGSTTQHVADQFGVSRQAIDIYRREFINSGLLGNQRAARTKRIITKETARPERKIISLEQQIDLVIEAFSALKRLPVLEAELEKCKRDYEHALGEMEHLQDAEHKRREQELRWLSVQLGSDINTLPNKSGEL